jgi:hypothetical protein
MTELVKNGIRLGAAASVAYICSTFAKVPDRRVATAWVSGALIIAGLAQKYVVPLFFPAYENRSAAQEQIYLICSHVVEVLSTVGLHQLVPSEKLPPFFTAFSIYVFSFVSIDIIDHGFKALHFWQKMGYLNANKIPLACHCFQSQGCKEAHCKSVVERASTSKEPTLFIQGTDTIGENSWHTALALSWKDQSRAEFLGIAQQTMQTPSEDGLETLQKIGPPPSGCQWIHVAAQCRNLYTHFSNVKQQQWKSIVSTDVTEDVVIQGAQQKLQTWFGSLKSETCTVELRLNQKESTPITVTLSWGEAEPLTSKQVAEKVTLTYIKASFSEMDWTLVTDLKVNNREDVESVLKMYDQQSMIKDYYGFLKLGHKIVKKKLQIDAKCEDLGIVTAEMMRLKKEIDNPQNSSPEKIFSEKVIKIIQGKFNLDKRDLTSVDILQHIGFIGGDPLDTPMIGGFWRGWLRLSDMIEGAALLKAEDKKSS